MQWTRHTLHNGLVDDSTENILSSVIIRRRTRERETDPYNFSFLINEHNNGA